MRYAFKLGTGIFILGATILLIALLAVYSSGYQSAINNEFQHTISIVDTTSINMEQLLLEKIKTTQTLSIMPILKAALEESNSSYGQLSEVGRDEKIHLQNERWKAIYDENDAFILEFTDNEAAISLKEQQNNIEGEYGEIFLTNKYGALVASTAKLTTFAHGDKYWWQGAINNGEGAVFIDDRGYDDSVGGYVLGLVVPVKQEDEIIGILKVNLNILGAISQLTLTSQDAHTGDFKLVRSGGEIIFEEGSEPLENRVPELFSEKLELGDNQPFVFEDSENKWLIGMSEIGITSGKNGFDFGGTFESVDHQKGNTGESWYIINYRDMANVLKPLNELTVSLFYIGSFLTIFLAFAALFLGSQTAKPLVQLMEQSKKIAKGNLSSRIIISRKDEIGNLGDSFNDMAEELEKTTTSIVNLESEIAERERLENKLRASEEKYRLLFENMLNGFALHEIVLDKVGKPIDYIFLETNDVFEQLTRLKNIVGQKATEVIPGIEKDPADWIGQYGKVALTGKEIRFIQYAEPLSRWYSVLAYSPKKGTFATIFEDITERKQAEEENRKMEVHLRQRQKLESIGTLASGVAHEINNPITGIMNYAQLIHDRIDPAEERLRKFSSGIIVETKRVAEIVSNLLTFSQQGNPVFNPTQMSDIVDNSLSLIRTSFRKDQITIEMDIPDDLPDIKCASQQIQQVLINLLTNARDSLNERYPEYNANKVIILTIHPFEKEGRQWLRTTVENHGAAIPTEARERIFDPFFTTKDRATGTGLGLSISLGIVQDHHGELTFESVENEYTRFYLDLPVDNGWGID